MCSALVIIAKITRQHATVSLKMITWSRHSRRVEPIIRPTYACHGERGTVWTCQDIPECPSLEHDSRSRGHMTRWCGRRKATVIPARLRAARDPCRMTGLLSMRAMLPRHENMLKAVDKPFGEARPTSGMLRCPDSMVEEMRAATEPITHNPPRIHDRGSTGRMC